MNGWERACSLLPQPVRESALSLPPELREGAEELRLRMGRCPAVLCAGREYPLPRSAPVTRETLSFVLDASSDGSPYACADTVSCGYIHAAGGVRVGICGRLREKNGGYAVSEVTSLCLRIPAEVRGCAQGLVRFPFTSTLIISPPGGGKTTLLRDMIRLLGDGGERVCLCDEREEIAGFFGGRPAFDVGRCTDIMTGCSKAEGSMRMLRTMDPTVLAMDEITAREDVAALDQAANCGVRLLATCHAGSRADLSGRPLYRSLLEREIFRRAIRIDRRGGHRSYEELML